MPATTTVRAARGVDPRVRRFDVRLGRVYTKLRGAGAPNVCLSRRELAKRLKCTPATIAAMEHRFIQMVRAELTQLGCENLSQVRFGE